MNTTVLSTRARMLEAFLAREESFEGLFLTALRTTGTFYQPTSRAPAERPRASWRTEARSHV